MGTLDDALGVVNGLLGDYLERTGNELAIEMAFVEGGVPIDLSSSNLKNAFPTATSKIAIIVHGSSATESCFTLDDGTNYGTLLHRDLGVTPLFVRFNSGAAIALNGDRLSRLIQNLVDHYPSPIDEILLIAHSMGGLVVRSACHAASSEGQSWLPLVRRAIYLGTPHRGAPLERFGKVVAGVLQAIDDPYTRLIADVLNLRSAGVKDLGDAHLRHEDRDSGGLPSLRSPTHPVPLLPSIRHYLIAGTLASDRVLSLLFGDSIVPIASATDGACTNVKSSELPPAHVRILPGLSHITLAKHADVYAQIRAWCEQPIDASVPDGAA